MANFFQDLRFGARSLRKNPGFTLTVIATLAIGIGANAAIFTVTSALLLRPLPYRDAQRLVLVEVKHKEGNKESNDCCTLARYEEVRDHSHSFSGVAAAAGDSLILTGHGEPVQAPIARVTANFFDVLGVTPQLGRTFSAGEDKPDAKPVILISDSLWRSRFGSDPGIIGQTVDLDSQPQTIIGVLPPNLQVPFLPPAEVWTPRYFELSLLTPQHIRAGVAYLTVLTRLKPAASIASAKAEMDVLNHAYSLENPKAPDTGPQISMAVSSVQEQVVADIRTRLLILSAAVGLVLLIACANVASLLLSRALARRKEIAVRAALGARRSLIVQQLLTESVLLSLLGGALGIALAWIVTRSLTAFGVAAILPSVPVGIDWRVLLFTLGLSVLTGLAFGIVPALQLTGVNTSAALRDEGRGTSAGHGRVRLKGLLVVSQVALSMLLLISAGLLGRSFARLLRVSPGFDPDNVLTMSISLPTVKYADTQKQIAFFDELVRRVSSLPGVKSAGTSAALPLTRIRVTPVLAEGQPEVPLTERPFTAIEAISPSFLQTMRIPLLLGRSFTDADNKEAPAVLIVNQAFAHRYWPDSNPVGKHIAVGRRPPAEVVGVAGNARNNGIALEADPQIYLPFAQLPWGNMNLFVRTAVDPRTLVSAVRQQMAQIDPDQPITTVQTVEELMDGSRAQPRFTLLLLGIFSGTALVLALVGIYGVLAYSVAQRRSEMGIRLALGAEKSDVRRLVVAQGLKLTAIGIAIGLIAALAFTRVLSSLLYEVSTRDATTFTLAPIVFLQTAMLAAYLPARRATQVDPLEAMRHE